MMVAPVLAVTGEAAPSATPSLPSSSMDAQQVGDYATGVLLVFGLLAVLALAARWMQSRNAFGRGGMRVLSSIGLGGKERLMVVDVEGKRLLIGVAPGGVNLIHTLHEPVASADPAPANGQNWLARTLSGGARS